MIKTGSMRSTLEGEWFIRELGSTQVRCFGHILNLVVKAILKDLGSSTHKDAVAYLNRAAEHLAKKNWTTIYVPGAGVIAKLRLMVLWINRSPQRIQEWDHRPNTSKRVNYDVDTRWNFTLRMIKDTFDCKAALKDTCDDHPELKELKLSRINLKYPTTLDSISRIY